MSLISRAVNIVIAPRAEWQAIDSESATVGGLYLGYAIPLSAISALARFIGIWLIGVRTPLAEVHHLPLTSALLESVAGFALGLVGIYIVSLIINGFASAFAGQRNAIQALKVAVYAATPAWIGGIFNLLPSLGIVALLASLYSLYVLYRGLPILMKAPQDKAMSYTITVVVCVFVVVLVIGLVTTKLGRFLERMKLPTDDEIHASVPYLLLVILLIPMLQGCSWHPNVAGLCSPEPMYGWVPGGDIYSIPDATKQIGNHYIEIHLTEETRWPPDKRAEWPHEGHETGEPGPARLLAFDNRLQR